MEGADLHCHTKLSDGSLGIDELVMLAVKRGLSTIAITDHDCQAGAVRAKLLGSRNGLKVIPGVEVTADDNGKRVHILAYLVESPEKLEGICYANSNARRTAGKVMMLKAMRLYPVSREQIIKCTQGSTNLYKQHIMHALMDCGFADSIYGDVYQRLFSADSPDSILTVPKYADIENVLTTIKDAGGIAVLAHPYLYNNVPEIEKYIEMGLDGLEAWHPTATAEQTENLLAIAKSNDLLVTGGSDFHGMYNRVRVTVGSCVTPPEYLNELLGYKAKCKRRARRAEKEEVEQSEKLKTAVLQQA